MVLMGRLIGAVLFAGMLSGCFSYFFPRYGYLARDSEKPDDTTAVIMEEHIPSIVNGYKPGEGHVGLDIIAEQGTPVLTVASGTVVLSDFEPMFGNRVEIIHGENINGEWVKSRYLHLQKRLVNPGDKVMRGQAIGSLGRSGLLSGGILHLHYELRIATEYDQPIFLPVHPHAYWLEGPGVISCYEPGRQYPVRPLRTTFPLHCSGEGNQ